MRKELLYFIGAAVPAVLINLALGIEFPASIATATAIVFVIVSLLVYLDHSRGRPSNL